jgi:hypothetical protein
MIFAAPWVLAALVALPLLWWLLRITPPSPRVEIFPAVRLLLGLRAAEETPAHTPWWLLLLRVAATALVILALAQPILDAGSTLTGSGPVLLVVDNGWASAPNWQQRMQAANGILDRAERAGRQAALLATAADGTGEAPKATPPMPVPELRARLAALQPQPWPPDRAASTTALQAWKANGTTVAFVADGLTDGADYPRFASALTNVGSTIELCCSTAATRVLLPPDSQADRLVVRLAQLPDGVGSHNKVLAQAGDGRTLADATIDIPSGASAGSADLVLPPELRNRLSQLMLEGPTSAGSTWLLDERWRRRPVGLVAGEQVTADAPLAGSLYYLRRALSPFTELREGDTATLLKRDLSVLILADRPLLPGAERDALEAWVKGGGLLIRFAGPRSAEASTGPDDPLLPVRLLSGDRQLGGALSWSEPAALAAFSPDSPFSGLQAADEVRVSRQILAEPSADLASHTWAALKDGTPLVTEKPLGSGRIVLFHVTANADWSNLPLSGLFVDMLRRLVALSAGIVSGSDNASLAPVETLDGFGRLSTPPPAAAGLRADEFGRMAVSPRHPPGLYGPESDRRALNLGTVLPTPEAAPLISGAKVEALDSASSERALGPFLLALAVLLFAADLLLSLRLRGLLPGRTARVAAVVLLAMLAPAMTRSAWALDTNPNPALATRLGYIVTGNDQVDAVSKAGLEGLSEYVNRRTAAVLVEPDAVEPGKTDLSFYPLLYWPITADAPALGNSQTSALNDYMGRGGIILIDTRDSGSGAGFAPGTDSALRRISQGLLIPPLAPLTTDHVLARAFYLLSDFPGRFTGDSVWVQRDQDRTNDSVSPVVIGGNDWASAWAIDGSGRNPYAVIPGGQRQRTLAYRFGVNLVMYALTGNYKGDQVHVPAILQRLGQ